METPAQSQKAHSPLMRILRAAPLVLMLAVFTMVLILYLLGGMAKIASWYLLLYALPVLGVVYLVATVIAALVRRNARVFWSVTTLATVIALLPLIAWFVPVAFPASLERAQPAAAVRLPADVPLKVAWGGNSLRTNYHAISPDQRWAYDLFVEPYVTGSDRLEDYGCYGVPVVAPADGLVTQSHDGEPDEVPGVASNNYTAPTGNHVVIQLETGTYLVIAHLKQGSVAVQANERVTEGQVIGQCGNSGNTSEPHIHIHHQRQDPAVFPLNFAEGLPLYFRDHDGPPMPVGGFEINGDTAIATGDVVQHVGK